MKKSLVSALTTAVIVGTAATSFAAANPFSDVPADHWAYDAIAQLAANNVIEGYGDGTFRGNQLITRYEMSKMVAAAMAKTDSVDATGKPTHNALARTDKALIDRLAAEFSDELNSLGVRVANLERNADKMKWNGELRYTYQSNRFEGQTRSNVDELLVRLEPSAEINEHWRFNSRLDAAIDMSADTSNDIKLQRAWAEGKYGSFTAKIGQIPDLTSYDRNMMFFNEMSGAELNFGKVLKAQVRVGRLNTNDNNRYDDSLKLLGVINNDRSVKNAGFTGDGFDAKDPMNMQSLALTYAPGKFSFTGAFYHFNSDIFRNSFYTQNADKDDANIWEVASTYRFDKNFAVIGAYLKNSKADYFKHSHVIHLDYKGSKKTDVGSWGAYASYRYQGANVSLDGANDGAMYNTKGWEFGTQYTLWKNVQLKAIYFKGKQLANAKDAEKLFGRVEFFF